MRARICVRLCLTTRPAPMFMWPTSLLPICPSGRPTASPEALRLVWGALAQTSSNTGVLANSTALPGPAGASPQPARMTTATGRVIAAGASWFRPGATEEARYAVVEYREVMVIEVVDALADGDGGTASGDELELGLEGGLGHHSWQQLSDHGVEVGASEPS